MGKLEHRSISLRLLLSLLLASLSWACDGGRPSGEGQTILIAHSIDMEGVNELITGPTPVQTALLYFSLFLPLFDEMDDYEDGPATLAPRLAERYEFSEDRLQLTFYLRDGVEWSDGEPVTAEDVRWTWQAQTDPDIAWIFADNKARITDVEVVDRLTARFHFSEAYGTQMLDANLGVVLPKHAWGRLPFSEWRNNQDWFADNLVVNGPFTLESREPQQRFTLRRNENYFEPGLPKAERIVFQVIPEAASQLALLRSGQLHFVEFVTPTDAAALESNPDIYLPTYLTRHFFFVQWNLKNSLFVEKKVRQALTMAIDRQGMIESLHRGYANISYSPFTSNTWVHNKALEPWPYDPQRSREMLAELGWRDSDGDGILDKDGRPFRFELLINSGNTLRRDIMVVIQAQLREIGIDVQTRVMEFGAMTEVLQNHAFDAVIFAVAMDTSFNTYHFFHTRAIDGGFNWGSFSHPEVDRVIEEIEREIDPMAAKPLYDELQVLLHDELPDTFLYESRRIGAARRELVDVNPNSVSSFFYLRYWRLVEESD